MRSKLAPLFLLIWLNGLSAFGQQLPQKEYAADIDGRVVVKGDQISIDVLDNPNNGENLNYSIVADSGMRYVIVNQQKYLVLVSNVLIYFFDSQGRLLFNGIAGSGRLIEFLLPAKTYTASSYLREKGIDYSARNLAYAKINRPWAVRAKSSGVGQTIEMSWDEEVGALVLINGFLSYSKPGLFSDNNRVKRIRVDADDSSEEFELKDSADPQLLFLKNASKEVKVTILDVYRGSKWDDTCVSMIQGFNSAGVEVLKQQR